MRPFEEIKLRIRHLRDPLTCREAVEIVTDYLEGAMQPSERERFERHLRACPDCVTYVDQVRTTAEVLGRVAPAPPAGATRDALIATFREFRRE